MSRAVTPNPAQKTNLRIGFAFGAGGFFACAMACAIERAAYELLGVDVRSAHRSVGTSAGGAYLAYRLRMSIAEGDAMLRGKPNRAYVLSALIRLNSVRRIHGLTRLRVRYAKAAVRLLCLRMGDSRKGLVRPIDPADPWVRRGLFESPLDRPARKDLAGVRLPANIRIMAYDVLAHRPVASDLDFDYGNKTDGDVAQLLGGATAILRVYGARVYRGRLLVDAAVDCETHVDQFLGDEVDVVIAVSPTARKGNRAYERFSFKCEKLRATGVHVIELEIPPELQPRKFHHFMRTNDLGPAMDAMYELARLQIARELDLVLPDEQHDVDEPSVLEHQLLS